MNNHQQERSHGRHHFLLVITAILLGSLLSGCSSGLAVRTDIDPAVDFGQYKTYNFFEPMGIEGGYNSPVFGEHFRASVSRELGSRGYRQSDTPDLLINVTIRGDDKVKMRSYSTPYVSGGYYGRPGGASYGSAMGVGVSAGKRATQVTEASVFLDFVDFERQRVVWQGVAVLDATDKVALQLRDAIYTAVNKMLAEYPHTAGN